jgi:hypothetical protein
MGEILNHSQTLAHILFIITAGPGEEDNNTYKRGFSLDFLDFDWPVG